VVEGDCYLISVPEIVS